MKAKLEGTQLNNLLVYADGNKIGRMDYENKRMRIFEWFSWIKQPALIKALIENDVEAGKDLDESEKYWNDVVITVEDL